MWAAIEPRGQVNGDPPASSPIEQPRDRCRLRARAAAPTTYETLDAPPIILFNTYIKNIGNQEVEVFKKILRVYECLLSVTNSRLINRYEWNFVIELTFTWTQNALPAFRVAIPSGYSPKNEHDVLANLTLSPRHGSKHSSTTTRLKDPISKKSKLC